MCLQQNLRHLQRCLKSDDLKDVWAQMDAAMFNAVVLLRCSAQNHELDQELMSLPTRLGGLGVLSYQEVAPHAFAAATESSEVFIQSVFNLEPPVHASIQSQKVRCSSAFEERGAILQQRLSPVQVAMFEENASKIGRKWLNVIPYSSFLTLSDYEVSTALHHHTLCGGDTPLCSLCGLENAVGHEEVCTGRANFRLARHELVKHALMNTLDTIAETTVEAEPLVPGSNLRTDFRVSGQAATTGGRSEYDLTIVSLAAAGRSGQSVSDYLESVRMEKMAKYSSRTATPFHPVVLGSGGAIESKSLEILKGWNKLLSLGQMDHLLRKISCILVRSRAKVFKF
jgi:hypothetical protein